MNFHTSSIYFRHDNPKEQGCIGKTCSGKWQVLVYLCVRIPFDSDLYNYRPFTCKHGKNQQQIPLGEYTIGPGFSRAGGLPNDVSLYPSSMPSNTELAEHFKDKISSLTLD